jgi:hypothetical protein
MGFEPYKGNICNLTMDREVMKPFFEIDVFLSKNQFLGLKNKFKKVSKGVDLSIVYHDSHFLKA